MAYCACTPKSLGDGNVSWLGLQTLKLECLGFIPGSAIISSETLGKLFNLSMPQWTTLANEHCFVFLHHRAGISVKGIGI